MAYVVMQQKEPDYWIYPEMTERGDIPEYPTKAEAEKRAKDLGGAANDYRAVEAINSSTLYQRS